MRRFCRYLNLICVGLITFVLAGCGNETALQENSIPEDKKLVIYTSHKTNIYEPIVKEFEERSGIWVKVVTGGTNEILNKVSQGENTEHADIMFGGGVDSLEVYKDCFEPYITSQDRNLDSTYASPEAAYTVFSKLPIVFVYNEKLVIQAGTPRTWEELLSSRWKGKIAFADPNQSGSSYTALTTMIQALQDKYDGKTVVRDFVQNLDNDVYDSSGDIIDAVVSGKKLIGITLEETALKQQEAYPELRIIYPQDGTSKVPDGCAIFKDAPHRENAELFMEFIVGDDVQRLLNEQLYRQSVRTDLSSKDDVKELNYDINFAITKREEILNFWDSVREGQ